MPLSPDNLDVRGSGVVTHTVGSADLVHVYLGAAGSVVLRSTSAADGAVLSPREARRLAVALLESAEAADALGD